MTQILKRLEIIKSSIAIEEDEIIELQIMKLNKLDIDDDVQKIIFHLEENEYSEALKIIDVYLLKYSGVVLYDDKELAGLKLELKSLEAKLQSLIEEKTEYLNDIDEFNSQYNLHLGELIKSILNLKKEILYKKTIQQQKLKEKHKEDEQTFQETKETIDELKSTIAELEDALESIDEDDENYDELSLAYEELQKEILKLEAELEAQEQELKKNKEFIEDETLEEEYEEVNSQYEEFESEYEHIKETFENSATLNDDEKKELKLFYKKAARLCHPDIVLDELKEKAHKIMQQLNDAYSKKDLPQIKKLLLSLETGTSFEVSSDKINDKEILKEKIKEFREELQNIQEELEDIKANETFQTIAELDDWDEYFEELKSVLEEEKEKLEEEASEVLADKDISENKSIFGFSSNNVSHDELTEEWMQTLWDWADENSIHESNVYLIADEDNQYFPLGGWNFVFTYAKSISELKVYLGVKNSSAENEYDETINELWNDPIFRDNYYGRDSWQIETCFELYTGISRSPGILTSSTFIDLSNKNLNKIPKEVFNLTALTHLDISNNHIGMIPEEIGNLTNLRVLALNGITATKLPDSIINLSNLEELYIYIEGLRLTDKQKRWIKKLKHYEAYIEFENDLHYEDEFLIYDEKNIVHNESTAYSKHIQSIENIRFEKIRKYCENLSKANEADEMQKYLGENGKMYKAIIYDALERFIAQLNGEAITIIDWGCSQGIASMLVLDYIKEKQLYIKVSDVILIDEDTKALSRAMAQVEALAQEKLEIKAFESVENGFLDKIKSNNTTLNLFANDRIHIDFLDIDYDIFKEAYFMCVSNENNSFVNEVYESFNDFIDVQDVSIRDDKIGRFERFERIFVKFKR